MTLAVKQTALDALGEADDTAYTHFGPVIKRPIQPPLLPPGVIPRKPGPKFMAFDDASFAPMWNWTADNFSGMGFPGYPYLAELCTKSEYRAPSETIATEMTRNWIRFITRGSKGKSGQSPKIEKIEARFRDLQIQECFRRAIRWDGFFGRAQIYIKVRGQTSDENRKLPLVINKATIPKNSLIGFKVIEPIWTTPYFFNANDPTKDNFYRPDWWYVLGKETHHTRLLPFISQELPDMLKPAYNFGGLSMTQLLEPYVRQWFRTRNDVSEMVHNYSTSGLKTNMSTLLEDNGESLRKRMEHFTRARANKGMMLCDKDTEDFFQYNTPLSGLSELQAQAQEHMAAPTHLPLVKLFGISPTGLNATAEPELIVCDDFVRARQESLCGPQLDKVLQIVQLDLFGEIDDTIDYEWASLRVLDDEALGRVRKADAERASVYLADGVIDADEERERLAADPQSGYQNLSGPAPGPPEPAETEGGGFPLAGGGGGE